MRTLVVARGQRGSASAWTVADPDAKLAWRASLPGAYGFDQAAHTLRGLQACGARAIDLLPLALPTSWMVNSKASSRAFRRWLVSRDAWASLLDAIGPGMSPEEWLVSPLACRVQVSEAVHALAAGGDGAGLAAMTKVLALLRPQIVPLMDDAALWFALDAAPRPDSADAPNAPASLFCPMLDWFATAIGASEKTLVAIASRHDRAVLDAAQVLDRLLWFESWGYRQAQSKDARWWWLKDGARESIVQVPAASGAIFSADPVDLSRTDLDPAWLEGARAAMSPSPDA